LDGFSDFTEKCICNGNWTAKLRKASFDDFVTESDLKNGFQNVISKWKERRSVSEGDSSDRGKLWDDSKMDFEWENIRYSSIEKASGRTRHVRCPGSSKSEILVRRMEIVRVTAVHLRKLRCTRYIEMKP
jgi:hypothetical protein